MSRLCKAACALSLLLIMLPAGLIPAISQHTSSASKGPIEILFTAVDKKSKRFVTTLRKEDVRVTEDGVPQEITGFKQQTALPLSIIIMLDMSVSQERMIPLIKQVSRKFVDSIIQPGRDSVGVLSFTNEAKFEQELSFDLEQARQAIGRVEFNPPQGYVSGKGVVNPTAAGQGRNLPGSTAIWDAVSFASEKFSTQPADNLRRVIVLFTDGEDTGSNLSLDEAVKRALKSGVVVYSIGLGDDYYGGVNEGLLKKISERTSGRAFFPKKVTEVESAFGQIEEELRSQYLISYSSSNNKMGDKMRKIKIEIVNPELRKAGLQLSYQQGYFTRG